MTNNHTNKKIVFVGFAFSHHKGTKSGYNRIKDYIKYDYIIDCQWEHEWVGHPKSYFITKVARRIYRTLFGDGCPISIIKCIIYAMLKRNLVFHFIYAENTYKWLHYFIGKTNKIVCTYHQPSNILRNYPKFVADLQNIDKIILMTQKDIDWFRQTTKKDNVYFIPHGINTDFYSPEPTITRKANLLMVGNWLRDFEFANEVFQILLSENPSLTVTIVTNRSNHSYFQSNDRLQLLSGITDNQLRDLYRTTKCFFLPLQSFTANNAILEAAASGCPIVVATDNADTSYFDKNQIDLIPLQIKITCEHLNNIINTEYDEIRAKQLRKFVIDNFSWQIVAEKTKLLF